MLNTTLNVLKTKYRESLLVMLDFFLIALGAVLCGLLFYRIFFNTNDFEQNLILDFSKWSVIFFAVQEIIRISLSSHLLEHVKQRALEIGLLTLFILVSFIPKDQISRFAQVLAILSVRDLSLAYLALTGFLAFFSGLTKSLRRMKALKKISLRPEQVFVLSFLTPVIIGSILLKLPKTSLIEISFIDSLFTAVSAICVTGLTTVSMHDFSFLGQFVILILIQLGGLGIMTFTIFFAQLFTGRVNLSERILMSELLSLETIGELQTMLLKICGITFILESIGAYALFRSYENYPISFFEKLWLSVFHSISAFCNAGFSLYTDSLAGPEVSGNYSYGIIISFLIILGGLGFPVLNNLQSFIVAKIRRKTKKRSLSIHSKLILTATPVLILVGGFSIYFFERNESFSGLSLMDSLYHSFFFSISSRTAGFNTWPTESLGAVTSFVIIGLMWVGAAPMSTGGGIKVTTLLTGLLHFWSQLRRSDGIRVFGRKISAHSTSRAFSAMFASIIVLSIGVFALFSFESSVHKLDLVFEAFSAWGTTGLSRGITADLSENGKITLILLMFTGRVGALAVLMSFIPPVQNNRYELLEENIIIY